MKITGFLLVLCLLPKTLSSFGSWSSIGSSITGCGESVWNGLKAIGQGFTGEAPSGYDYDFQVFNGANVPIYVDMHESRNIMGARFHVGGGDSATVNPGDDSGNTFTDEHLYFSITMSANGSQIYSDDHYTLGQRNDKTVYMYHAFNDKDSGKPTAELIGGGYTSSSGFSGRIENKLSSSVAVTFTLTNASQATDVRTLTIPDIDPAFSLNGQTVSTFNYLTCPQGYFMRPSTLVFSPGGTVVIGANGLAQITSTATAKQQTSNPSTYNYIVATYSNGVAAYETGMGPGNFNQPQDGSQLRDISPVVCQINNQGANETVPIGTLLPYDISWQSLWYVYTGYGWSQAQQSVIQCPTGQIPKGASALCMFIRPSLAFQTQGPARFFLVRLNIPETPNAITTSLAQTFLANLAAGKVLIKGLVTGEQGTFIRKNNVQSLGFNIPLQYSKLTSFDPAASPLVYPSLSTTMFGSSVQVSALTQLQKSELLGLELPNDIGVLHDPESKVSGYLMASDCFYSYGMGGGPYYYSIPSPYLDLSQMLGSFMNYASVCNYTALTQTVISQIQQILTQTVIAWTQDYFGNPLQVKESIATLLYLLGKGNIQALQNFSSSSSALYTDPNALASLSPQGNALLKMFLYGPCSMSQLPIYYKSGSMSFTGGPGWPAPTVFL